MRNDWDHNLHSISEGIAKATQDKILEQLGDLLTRNLLVIEQGPGALVQMPGPHGKLEYHREVTLKLRDREYVEALEEENRQLRACLERASEMQEVFRSVSVVKTARERMKEKTK